MLEPRLTSKWWRLNNLYKIKDKQGNIVKFQPNFIQAKYLANRVGFHRNLILKPRQLGFTTLAAIDYLDDALWTPGMTAAILAHEREATDRIFEIVKRAYNFLPDKLKPKTKTDTKRMYEFTHRFDGVVLDSSIYVAMKLRGGTVQKLHITESAYIKNRAELEAGSKQAVPITGYITEETTGNGFNDFQELYMTAREKPNPGPIDYKTHFFAWFENPEYSLPGTLEEKTSEEVDLQYKYNLTDGQLIWRRWKKSELRNAKAAEGVSLTGEQLFKQEYPSTIQEAFQSGAGTVFDAEHLDRLTAATPLTQQQCLDAIGENEEAVGRFKVLWAHGVNFWHLPEPGKIYDIGIDPSDGEGADSSCIDVWEHDDNQTKVRQCAQFYGKIHPDDLAELGAMMGWFYNHAIVAPENNMLTTVLFLSKIYDKYYFEYKIDERTAQRTKKIGWSTNIKTRDVMIDEFVIYFDDDLLEINSPITIREMKTFIKGENGKREHAPGKHDDTLFGAFIAIQMRKFDKPTARVFANNPL